VGQQTTTIATVRFFRQDDPPQSAPDGATWVTPSDGAGNDTSSRYVYDAAAEAWELESAVGPSEPSLGVPVAGATWRDTSNAVAKQYDGAAFVSLTPQFTNGEGPLPQIDSQVDSFSGTIGASSTLSLSADFSPRDIGKYRWTIDNGQVDLDTIRFKNGSEIVFERTGDIVGFDSPYTEKLAERADRVEWVVRNPTTSDLSISTSVDIIRDKVPYHRHKI
jgi:hypothetical protein